MLYQGYYSQFRFLSSIYQCAYWMIWVNVISLYLQTWCIHPMFVSSQLSFLEEHHSLHTFLTPKEPRFETILSQAINDLRYSCILISKSKSVNNTVIYIGALTYLINVVHVNDNFRRDTRIFGIFQHKLYTRREGGGVKDSYPPHPASVYPFTSVLHQWSKHFVPGFLEK